MMNSSKHVLGLLFIVGVWGGSSDARFRIVFDEPADSFEQVMENAMRPMFSMGPSKEDRDALKAAQEKLNKIDFTVKEQGDAVQIAFTGFEGLTKDMVKVVKEGGVWCGTINLKEGRVAFCVTPHGVQVESRVEVKKEEKSSEEDKATAHAYCMTASSRSKSEAFSGKVDIDTLKAQPIRADEFTLTVTKRKEIVLPLT